jgi:hypothetical protein
MASATQDLESFVRDALAQGTPRETIASTLTGAGWSQAQVQRALNAWADVPFPVPVPRPRASLSAREAFFYLLMFAALYMAAWHACSLLFKIINHAMPDATDLSYWDNSVRTMRWSVASLLIAFPVFLWMARIVARQVSRDPVARLSPVRRWLTYLTLFLAAMALIGDMIVLLDNLLAGDLTLRFVLKVSIVAITAGSIFSYYLLDLRRGESVSLEAVDRLGKWLAIGATVLVAATVVLAVRAMGTPMQQRMMRIDDRRVEELRDLQDAVREWAKTHGTLPESLAQVDAQPGVQLPLADPEGRAPYEYARVGPDQFRLCAVFSTDSAKRNQHFGARGSWAHGAGRHCYTRVRKPGNDGVE